MSEGIVECPVCGTPSIETDRDIGIVYEAGYRSIGRHKPVISSDTIEAMEAVLKEIRDYPIDEPLSHEALIRAFGRWTTQARMILGPPLPMGDKGKASG